MACVRNLAVSRSEQGDRIELTIHYDVTFSERELRLGTWGAAFYEQVVLIARTDRCYLPFPVSRAGEGPLRVVAGQSVVSRSVEWRIDRSTWYQLGIREISAQVRLVAVGLSSHESAATPVRVDRARRRRQRHAPAVHV